MIDFAAVLVPFISQSLLVSLGDAAAQTASLPHVFCTVSPLEDIHHWPLANSLSHH